MIDWPRFGDLAFRVLGTALLYVFVTSAVLHSFLAHESFQHGTGDLSLEAMVDGEARRPFAHRVLSHAVVRAVANMVPDAALQGSATFLQETSPLLVYRKAGSDSLRESLYLHVGYAWCFVSLMALVLLLRRLTRIVFPTGPPGYADVAPAIGLLFLPQSFILGGYLYDFAELALLVGALGALFERRLGWFAAFFVLGVLNKETSLLWLVVAGGVLRNELEPRVWGAYLAGLAGIGVGLVGAVVMAHQGNPGASVEVHLLDNLGFWLWWPTYLATMDGFAPLIPVPRGGHVVQLFLVAWAVVRGWPSASDDVRWAIAGLAAVHLPLFLVFGFFDEIRALAPLFPGLYLLACHAVGKVWASGSRT